MPALDLRATSRSIDMFSSPVVKPALIAVFTAESLVTNYALTGIPNVKLMDVLIFAAGFLFGWTVSIGIALSTWAIYGFINPYGQAGFPLIIFLMIGECFYAIGGALLRRSTIAKQLLSDRRLTSSLQIALIFGIAGLGLTFAYDLLTNFATYMFLTPSLYQALLIGVVTGAPFALLHEGSNLLIFALAGPAGIVAARRVTSGHGSIARQ